MEREEIACVVRKHLADVVGDLKESDIDMSLSMKDLGATSLDMVEVVSLTMRELKVKVPRSELGKLTNMDGLVDLLHASMLEKVKAAPTT
ncbi:MAG TPA: phosphopantetheine-binding protein [Terriglobia bacterium]|nr:phosphopantetheine-binding protein [Terriglobia bacterium]